MPVASTRNRLTHEGYRPPPKTWEEIMGDDSSKKKGIDSPALHPRQEQQITKQVVIYYLYNIHIIVIQ